MPVITIDCEYLFPQFAASYLLIDHNHGAFVDNNTAHSVPILLQTLKAQNLAPESIDFLIVTHIHLDHAGGTELLSRACPNALILAHPKAAPHLIDPTKLVSSARKVYGDDEFKKLYGEIHPIPSERVRMVKDGEVIQFGKRTLTFFHTRGHANHHFSIYDNHLNGVFTGDSFGLAYPALQKQGLFIFPSTSPTDFDPTEARLSIKKIIETGAETAYLTHFGGVSDLKAAADQLYLHLDFSEKLLEEATHSSLSDEKLSQFCEIQIHAFFKNYLKNRKIHFTPKEWDLLKLDLKLNAAGIAYVATKRRQKNALT